jgi:hypothetical protein
MRAMIVLSVAALLCGCADARSGLDNELQPYVGRNVSALSGKLGPPTKQTPTAGGTEYTWVTSRGVDAIVDGQEFSATQTNQQTGRVNTHCTLAASADSTGVIKSYRWDGNCDAYANSLK